MTQLTPPPPGSAGAADHLRPAPAADILDALLDNRANGVRRAERVVPTGVSALDGSSGGIAAGTVTAVIAPAGTRPTWLLFRAALHAATNEHVTFFYALDAPMATFAVGMANLVMGTAAMHSHVDGPTQESALRAAARELAQLPLYAAVGETVSTHDIFAAVDDDLVELVVIDNYGLLLPAGRARDLKHLAIDLNVAVLASALAAGEENAAGGRLETDLLTAADTISHYEPRTDSCQVVLTRRDLPTLG